MASTLSVWNRYWKVELETTQDTFEVFESPNFWVEFDVKYDSNTTSTTKQSTATISIYNIDPKLVEIVKPNNRITLSAGYSDNKGMIFRGLVKGITSKRRGGDVEYRFKCVPNTDNELQKFVVLKTVPPEPNKPDWISTGKHIIETLINKFTTLQVKYITDSAAQAEITNYAAMGVLDNVLRRLAAEVTSITGVDYVYGVLPEQGWFYFAEEGEKWGDVIYIHHDVLEIGTEVATKTNLVTTGEVPSLEEEEAEESTTSQQYKVITVPLNPSLRVGQKIRYVDADGSIRECNPVYIEHSHDGKNFITTLKEVME